MLSALDTTARLPVVAATDRFRTVFDGTLDWFVANLKQFDPFKGDDGTEFDSYYVKPFLELASLCMLHDRFAVSQRDPRVAKVALFIHGLWRRPEYKERLLRYPEMLLVYGMTYIALDRYGLSEPFDRELLQRVVDEGYATAVERLPFRCLDLRCMLDCGGFSHNLPSYASLYEETLLAKTPSVLYLTDTDAYAVTHTIFYLYDFGSRSPDVIPKEQVPTIRWIVGALLGVYLRRRHWDLVAELLICCECLRWRPAFLFDAAWSALAAAQRRDGVVPGPYFSEEKEKELKLADQRTYYLKENYHTTLVSALAALLSGTAESGMVTPES